jgi:putative ribosome biogenesis GTPase RsgA
LQPQPLLTPEDQDRFLVPFAQDTLEQLDQLLELMPWDTAKNKIVLSGHTGCGKSTLLAELRHKIADRYFVIFF